MFVRIFKKYLWKTEINKLFYMATCRYDIYLYIIYDPVIAQIKSGFPCYRHSDIITRIWRRSMYSGPTGKWWKPGDGVHLPDLAVSGSRGQLRLPLRYGESLPISTFGEGFLQNIFIKLCYLNDSFVLLDAYNSEFNLNNIIGNPRSVSHKSPVADLFFLFSLIIRTVSIGFFIPSRGKFHHLLVRIEIYKTAFSYRKIFIFIPLKGRGHDFGRKLFFQFIYWSENSS